MFTVTQAKSTSLDTKSTSLDTLEMFNPLLIPLLRFIYKAIPKSTTIFQIKSRDFICLSFVYVFLYFWFIFIGKLRSLIVTLEHHVKDLPDKEARVSSCR